MRIIASIYLLLFSLVLSAQHKSGDIAPTHTIDGQESWPEGTKVVMIYIFAFIILILVIRTFRNSSDA